MATPALVLALVLGSCAPDADDAPIATKQAPTRPAPASSTTPSPSPTATPTPEPGTVAPAWLGTRPLPLAANGLGEVQPTPVELQDRRFTLKDRLDPLSADGFASSVTRVPTEVLNRSSWRPECPVEADDLRWVRVAFWGFDGRRHTGELLVHEDVADGVVQVFHQLFDMRFPMEEMRITRADELDAEPTGDGNNTSAFTCRPIQGTTSWSEHAKGRAVDINPFHNPYIRGDMLIPELASAYLDRSRQSAGLIHRDDAVVQAFASVGWAWGGNWQHSKDYMHFSANGR